MVGEAFERVDFRMEMVIRYDRVTRRGPSGEWIGVKGGWASVMAKLCVRVWLWGWCKCLRWRGERCILMLTIHSYHAQK